MSELNISGYKIRTFMFSIRIFKSNIDSYFSNFFGKVEEIYYANLGDDNVDGLHELYDKLNESIKTDCYYFENHFNFVKSCYISDCNIKSEYERIKIESKEDKFDDLKNKFEDARSNFLKYINTKFDENIKKIIN